MEHLAIIADGNRRWAKERGKEAADGHTAGLSTIERACEWAINKSIPYLTVYCFSTENWGRAKTEIDNIFHLARIYFGYRVGWYVKHGIRVRFIGRKDRLPQDLLGLTETVQNETQHGDKLTMTICVDYGGRDEIVRAVNNGALTEEEITAALTVNAPCPDVILRTGGRHRLSNFLLWQAAYSEIYFTDTLFPALTEAELDEADRWFDDQVRTFGK